MLIETTVKPAHAATITKTLKSYHYSKDLFTSRQLGAKVIVNLVDAIAYNHDRYFRLIEVLEGEGYDVYLSGRSTLYVTKAA